MGFGRIINRVFIRPFNKTVVFILTFPARIGINGHHSNLTLHEKEKSISLALQLGQLLQSIRLVKLIAGTSLNSLSSRKELKSATEACLKECEREVIYLAEGNDKEKCEALLCALRGEAVDL